MNYFRILLLCVSSIVFSQKKVGVYFDFNQKEINSKSKTTLDSLCNTKKEIVILKIHGYADAVDTNQYNDSLSFFRAKEVANYLKNKQVKWSQKSEIKGFGENAEFKNQQKNRRVLIYYTENVSIPKKVGVSENSSFESIPDPYFDLAEAQKNLIKQFRIARKNDVFVFQNMHFYINSEKLIPESEPILETLFEILAANQNLVIEIYGHICCNRNTNDTKLSYRRAKFIFDYLIKRGIPTHRLGYRGYGSAQPIYKIPEKNTIQEQANRRIEIKIMNN